MFSKTFLLLKHLYYFSSNARRNLKGISGNVIIFHLLAGKEKVKNSISLLLQNQNYFINIPSNSIILLALRYSLHPSPYVLSQLSKISWSREASRSSMHGKKIVELDDAQYFTIVFRRKKKKKCICMCIYMYTRMKYSSWQALTHIESHGWVEQFEPPMFSDDGDTFLTILPKKQHDGSYWRHAVAITNVSSATPRKTALTSGRFVVTEIVSWDQKKSYL